MKERPILHNGEMVRAILREADPKTQTRRVVKLAPLAHSGIARGGMDEDQAIFEGESGTLYAISCPYGKPGDLLWVR